MAETSFTENEPQVWCAKPALCSRIASRIAAYCMKRRFALMPTARR